MSDSQSTHSLGIGYVVWIFGFIGAHRFYYGKQISGTIWFFTGGLVGMGVLYDLWTLNEQLDALNTEGSV